MNTQINGLWKPLQEGYTSCFDLYEHAAKELSKHDRKATVVEVGAWRGCSTAYLVEVLLQREVDFDFYVVDIWTGKDDELLEGVLTDMQVSTMFPTFLENTKPIWQYIKPIHLCSANAARAFDDWSLDFVYIDALHTYDAVITDMYSWFNKVKPGGILGGHDYSDHWPDVKLAVDEFVAKHQGLQLDTRFVHSANWFIKV